MDSHRNRILKDLAQTLSHRTIKAAEEMAALCKLANIPQYEFDAAASAVYLYIFMHIILDTKPSMTPHELGQLVTSQFKLLKESENDSKSKT